MANSDDRGVRHVRCPRCHSLLQEPSGVPVYQCGGCGTSLRAKNRSGDTQDVASSASPSRNRLPPPPQRRHLGSGDVASTSRSSTPTPDARNGEQQATGTTTTRRYESGDLVSARKHGSSAVTTSSRRQAADTRSQRESGDLVSASKRVSEHVLATEKKEHDQGTNRGAYDNSEFRRQRDTGVAERNVVSPGVSVNLPRGTQDAGISELQVDTEKRRKGQAEPELPDAARNRHSGEAAVQPQFRDREEMAPKSAEAAESKPSRDATAAAGGKVPSPPRHELQAEDLAPLRQKILKTVDELKGDLSELFSKSPDLNPTKRARPPRLPKQEGYASRCAAASTLPARARHAAAVVNRHGNAARAVMPGHQVAAAPPRGLPSRRYRRCRADPCCENVLARTCHHGCCHHHGKPECSSCRGHCGRPTRAQEPSAARKPPATNEAKRRSPPRHHCRPVLKGAPFIICSSCFKLVQVPADFAVSTNRLRKLRCGSCSAVLSYSYRDPGRKKPQDSIDQFSTDGSEVHGGKGYAQRDPFAPFLDDFGLSSYSTEDEPPLHVSRNTSFDTVDGLKGVGRLHRLMGYGSASELLRHSPDLYESFDERTTPDYDRKGKGVCIDAEHDDFDDSDDENSGVLKRSAARGAVWPLPRMLGKGVPGPGAIRIKS